MLWYVETAAGEQLAELPYLRLRSVELVREPKHRLMAGGTVLAILGLFLWFSLGLVTPILAVAFGLGLIFVGAQGKEAYYQLRSDRMTRQEAVRWRIPFQGSLDFIVAVGERSGRRLTEG